MRIRKSVKRTAKDANLETESPAAKKPKFATIPKEVANSILNHFAQQFATKIKQQWHVFSPLSLYLVLSMASLGASGACKEQFQQVLGGLDSSAQQQILALCSDMSSCVSISNMLLLKSTNFDVAQEFVASCKQLFQAEVKSFDEQTPSKQVVQQVNQWAATKTNNMITRVLPDEAISKDTILMLVNAIYFKGLWTVTRFDKADTVPKPFTGLTKTSQVSMMHMSNVKLPYYETETYCSVCLPYEHDQFCLLLVKPNDSKNTSDVSLLADALGKHDEGRLTALAIPKMTLETELHANNALRQMGLTMAFEVNGFATIDPKLCISSIFQKARIEIDEVGTKAAAVTLATKSVRKKLKHNNISFVLNASFLYALVHVPSQAIVFMGQVFDL